MGKSTRSLLNKRFDLTGNELSRTCRQMCLSRFFPTGNTGGGAGFRCLMVLSLLHYSGRPAFWLLCRQERLAGFLNKILARLRRR